MTCYLFLGKLNRKDALFRKGTRHLSFFVSKQNNDLKNNKLVAYRRIFKEIKPVKYRLGSAFVLSTFSSGIMMLIPYFTGWIIDQAVNGSIPLEQLTTYGTTLFIIQGGSNFLRQYLTNTSGNIVIRDLRERTFSKLLEKDISYFDQNQSGEIVSRLTSDCQIIGNSATVNLNDGFRAILQFSIATAMAVKLSPPELLGISIGGVVAIIAVSRGCGTYIKRYTKKQQHWTAQAAKIAQEKLSSIRTVRAFGHDRFELGKYSTLVRAVQATTEKEARAQAALFSLNPFMGNMLLVYLLSCSVPYLQNGSLSAGDVTALLLYGTFSGAALGLFASFYSSMNKAIGASDRIWKILDEERNPVGGKFIPSEIYGNIQLRNIHFSYPSRPDVNILHNISLDIPADSTLAIVGKSGSGKSTIPKILYHFYGANSGEILLDGVNWNELDYNWMRQNMAMVPQDPELFSDTIRNNICYGAVDPLNIGDDEIIGIAKKANAWEFIKKLPDKLETEIGESGVLLSGGQRQRLVIARALIRNPRILILDEATSALDAESEMYVQGAIDNLASENLTLIIIAHRLSTIKNANKIIVLDNGRVLEEGTFNELVNNKTVFADFVNRQTLT